MAIPDYQTLMRPLLNRLSDGREHSTRELRDQLAGEFDLTQDELRTLVPSGKKLLFADRLSWVGENGPSPVYRLVRVPSQSAHVGHNRAQFWLAREPRGQLFAGDGISGTSITRQRSNCRQ
jgi:restriction endonuclease Mrr